MSDEILTVKKENVLAAAKECSDANRVLRKIFPDVFDEKCFEVGDIVKLIAPNNAATEIGMMGIVKEIRKYLKPSSDSIGVEFIDNFGGHEIDGLAHNGHGHWMEPKHLELVYRPKK